MSAVSASPTRSASRASTPDPGFDVVVLGAGLNALNLCLAFHQEYGIRCTNVMRVDVGMNMWSITTDPVVVGAEASDDELCTALEELAQNRDPQRPALLLTNADSLIAFIDEHRNRLEKHYRLAQIDSQLLDQLADKARFAEICADLGIATPATVVVDFAQQDAPDWNGAEPLPWQYPCVAKAANTAEYHPISMPDKRKVFLLETEQERADLVSRLQTAGFEGRFLFQELVPGDDTTQRSITAYRSSRGHVTLLCAAQVILGEHTPDALGRPAAMITGAHPDLTASAERFLDAVDYVGFANFDVKVDPRDGVEKFFEINPRIGRNSYYVTGAGESVARHIVEDLVHGRDILQVTVTRPVLYSILPVRLLLRYVRDSALRMRIRHLARTAMRNPFRYPGEGLRMRIHALLSGINAVRKYRRFYPRPTETGF